MCRLSSARSAVAVDTWLGAGILALAISAAITWWRTHELWTAHVAAGLVTVAMPFGLLAVGAAPVEIALALLIVAVVLTGTSFLLVSSGPFATAGMTASAVAVVVTPGDAPVLVSVAVVILGAQVALEGLVRSRRGLTRAGAGVAAVGAISMWWTTGADDAVLGWLAPHGVTSGDLAVAAVSVLLLAAGAYAGRTRSLSSWATAGPGVGLLALWLLDAQLTRDVGWSVPLALGVGIVAVAVGGWRRMAAPLVIGTATIGYDHRGFRRAEARRARLVGVDGRGGLGLIALAVFVERRVGADRTPIDWRRLRSNWR